MNNLLMQILLCRFMLFSSSMFSQQTSYPYEEERYDFINSDLNKFYSFDDTFSSNYIYKKYGDILQKGKGQLKIVHIGGSHIQADIYTNRMRQRMIDFCYGSNGGRGFLFPYTIAQTNNPWNYKVNYSGKWEHVRNIEKNTNCNLGLSGIIVHTNDAVATISIKTRDSKNIHYNYTHLKLFCNIDSTGYRTQLNYPRNYYKKNVRIDSNYIEYSFKKEYDSLSFSFIRVDTLKNDFELYGLYLCNDNAGIVYSAIGVNGASLGSFLKCNLFENQLSSINPDLVVISLGTNDANTDNFHPLYYQQNYIKLILKIKNAVPNASILLTVPNDSFVHSLYVNNNTEKAREVIFTIAKEYNCSVWDLFQIMGGLESCETWYNFGLMKEDHVHFTVTGYILKGDLFFNAFLNGFNEYINNNL